MDSSGRASVLPSHCTLPSVSKHLRRKWRKLHSGFRWRWLSRSSPGLLHQWKQFNILYKGAISQLNFLGSCYMLLLLHVCRMYAHKFITQDRILLTANPYQVCTYRIKLCTQCDMHSKLLKDILVVPMAKTLYGLCSGVTPHMVLLACKGVLTDQVMYPDSIYWAPCMHNLLRLLQALPLVHVVTLDGTTQIFPLASHSALEPLPLRFPLTHYTYHTYPYHAPLSVTGHVWIL